MKNKFLIAALFIAAFFTSCNNEPKEKYYIKHPFGSGADEDWEWVEMKYQKDGTYVYEDLFGGTGVNISGDDNHELWFPIENISFYLESKTISEPISVGDKCKFVYDPTQFVNNRVSITKISNEKHVAYVRFQKEDDTGLITDMSIAKAMGGELKIYATKHFGLSSGISEYYEIPIKYSYPLCTVNGNPTYLLESNTHTYYFEDGLNYTIICSMKNGQYSYGIKIDW